MGTSPSIPNSARNEPREISSPSHPRHDMLFCSITIPICAGILRAMDLKSVVTRPCWEQGIKLEKNRDAAWCFQRRLWVFWGNSLSCGSYWDHSASNNWRSDLWGAQSWRTPQPTLKTGSLLKQAVKKFNVPKHHLFIAKVFLIPSCRWSWPKGRRQGG